MVRRYKLMIPGPTECPEYVLREMAAPTLPHYESEWAGLYWQIVGSLQKVLGTRSEVFPVNGSGTLSFEIAMASLLAPGDRVLSIANSAFGKGLAEAAQRFGAQVTCIVEPMFRPVASEAVAAALGREHYSLVTVVHHDTASGFLAPLDELGALCRERDVPLLVDCVSSVGALPFEMDRWGVDLACASVQKALDCPAGLAIIGVSEKAWRKISAAGPLYRGRYMNLAYWRAAAVEQRDWHPNMVSVATNNMMGLKASLEHILDEGLENRFRRMRRYGEAIRRGIRNLGLDTFVEDRYSPLVTRVVFPEGMSAAEARDWLRFRHNILVGVDFRIPHFGAGVNEESIRVALLALEDYVRSCKPEVPRGISLEGTGLAGLAPQGA